MKTLVSHITEAIKSEDKNIIEILNFYAKNMSGVQQELYKQKIKDADSIDVVPLREVFSEDEIKEIRKRIKPQPKMCYENAYKLCDRFEYENKHDIKYCEGYLNLFGLPIDHAFNKVDGKYVDITVELALNKKISSDGDTYVILGEYDINKVREILVQNGFYGDIYNTIFLNKYNENIKKAS